MSISRLISTVTLLASLLTGTGIIAAQQPDKDFDKILAEIKPYKHEFFVKFLALDTEQKQNFLPLYDKMEEEVLQINEDTRELERSITDNPEASDIETEAAARAIFEQKQREALVELKYYEDFKKVLTPQQLLRIKSAERRFTQKLARSHRKMHREKVLRRTQSEIQNESTTPPIEE